MSKIIICVDGSDYSQSICEIAIWAQKRIKGDVEILHIAAPSEESVSKLDLSGTIGVGSRKNVLENLVKIDEEHGKSEQQKGRSILEKAQKYLINKVSQKVETLHIRGSVDDVIIQLQNEADLIIVGKRGEKNQSLEKIGSNLEKIARSTHKPLLIASDSIKPIDRFLIAYDGSFNGQKIIDYVIKSPLLKNLECDLLTVAGQGSEAEKFLNDAKEKLTHYGLKVNAFLKQGKFVEDIVKDHILEQGINLLLIGAYGHSKIRSFILGSTTNELLKKTHIPILLLR